MREEEKGQRRGTDMEWEGGSKQRKGRRGEVGKEKEEEK